MTDTNLVRRSARLANVSRNSHTNSSSSLSPTTSTRNNCPSPSFLGHVYTPHLESSSFSGKSTNKRQTSRQILTIKAEEKDARGNFCHSKVQDDKNKETKKSKIAQILKNVSIERLNGSVRHGKLGFPGETAKEKLFLGKLILLLIFVSVIVFFLFPSRFLSDIISQAADHFKLIEELKEETIPNRKNFGQDKDALEAVKFLVSDNNTDSLLQYRKTRCPTSFHQCSYFFKNKHFPNTEAQVVKINQITEKINELQHKIEASQELNYKNLQNILTEHKKEEADDLKRLESFNFLVETKLEKMSQDISFMQNEIKNLKEKIEQSNYEEKMNKYVKKKTNDNNVSSYKKKIDWASDSLGGLIIHSESVSKFDHFSFIYDLKFSLDFFVNYLSSLFRFGNPSHMQGFFQNFSKDFKTEIKSEGIDTVISANEIISGKRFTFETKESANITILLSKPTYISEVAIYFPLFWTIPDNECIPRHFSVFGEFENLACCSSACNFSSQSNSLESCNFCKLKNVSSTSSAVLSSFWLNLGDFEFVFPSEENKQFFSLNTESLLAKQREISNTNEVLFRKDQDIDKCFSEDNILFNKIRFSFHSNYGGNYTCIYRLKVFEIKKN